MTLLGSGSMGAVYEAVHRLMERPVALKVMAANLVSSTAMVERVRREVKAAGRLSHPNIHSLPPPLGADERERI